jgi:nitrogen fixation/metabolism regulation signal transduction histidine kinase
MNKHNPRRTKKFIDSRVQGALARRIILHWLVFLGVGVLVAFILQVLSNPFRPLASHAQDMWWTHGPFLLVLVFLLPVFVVDTIKLSHRFAGPIYALRKAIREVAQGDKPRRLKFRKRDFWRDLADDYNAMLEKLEVLDGNDKSADDKKLVASK